LCGRGRGAAGGGGDKIGARVAVPYRHFKQRSCQNKYQR